MTFSKPAGISPPKATKRPVTRRDHGVATVDDYGWLRADNWQEVMRDPAALPAEIRAHLEAENAYQRAVMADTEALQATLLAEMKGRIREDDSSPPMPDGPWAYGTRFVAGAEHPIMFRVPRNGGPELKLLNGDEEAAGKEFFRLGGSIHSSDHRWLAWACDEKGSELYIVRFRDLETGRDLPWTVADTSGGGVFSEAGGMFFYTRVDDNHRPSKVFRRRFAQAGAADELVFEEADPGMFVSVGMTHSKRFIVIDSHDHETSQAWLIAADAPQVEMKLVAARRPDTRYEIEECGGKLYILTNCDGAKDFKIVTAPAGDPGPGNWTDLIPHVPGRLILDHAVFQRHLVRLERENGLPRIVVRRLADGVEHAIAFDEEAYSLGMGGALEFDTDTIRFTYSSMRTPTRTYDYNMESRQRVLVKEQEVPSGHDPENYVTRRIFARARDGETIPVTLLYHRRTTLDGSAPCLLYGYGSYGITVPAAFNTNLLSLVDRGFVYAVAHVRGGMAKGFAWYEAGKRLQKPNTFHDFIAAAEHLIATRYTGARRIVIHGGSAGGLLVGAVLNQRPDLFAGAIGEVPFVDVLNTMLDASLPLTPPEWPEWGNPIASKEDFEMIRSYAPYENLHPESYPPVLAVAGLTDPRVTYWEPAKWIARLRENNTGDAPIMLRTHMGAGHAGSPGRFAKLSDIALVYAFAIRCANAPETLPLEREPIDVAG
jgi:oligopeptidase B